MENLLKQKTAFLHLAGGSVDLAYAGSPVRFGGVEVRVGDVRPMVCRGKEVEDPWLFFFLFSFFAVLLELKP